MAAVHGAVTRRGVLARSLRIAKGCGVGGVLALASAACGFGAQRALPALPPTLAVAVPSGGPHVRTNEAVSAAVGRALHEVNLAAGGRFRIDTLLLDQNGDESGRGWQTQANMLAPLLGSGPAPDLLVFTSGPNPAAPPREFAAAVELRWLEPLDDYLKSDRTLLLADFAPATLDVCRYRGHLVGIPITAIPTLLVYDTHRFAEARLEPPHNGWNWARFMDAARQLTRDTNGDGRDDQFGLYPGVGAASVLSLIWQNDGQVFSSDLKRALLTESRAREAMEYYSCFFQQPSVSPPLGLDRPQPGPNGIWLGARWPCAMLCDTLPAWLYDREWPVAAGELPAQRQRATALGVTSVLSVARTGRAPALAAEALKLLAEHTTRQAVPPARHMLPGTLQALEPRLAPGMAQMLVNSLSYSRSLMLGDVRTTQQVLEEIGSQLVPSLLRGPATIDRAIQYSNASLQRRLDALKA